MERLKELEIAADKDIGTHLIPEEDYFPKETTIDSVLKDDVQGQTETQRLKEQLNVLNESFQEALKARREEESRWRALQNECDDLKDQLVKAKKDEGAAESFPHEFVGGNQELQVECQECRQLRQELLRAQQVDDCKRQVLQCQCELLQEQLASANTTIADTQALVETEQRCRLQSHEKCKQLKEQLAKAEEEKQVAAAALELVKQESFQHKTDAQNLRELLTKTKDVASEACGYVSDAQGREACLSEECEKLRAELESVQRAREVASLEMHCKIRTLHEEHDKLQDNLNNAKEAEIVACQIADEIRCMKDKLQNDYESLQQQLEQANAACADANRIAYEASQREAQLKLECEQLQQSCAELHQQFKHFNLAHVDVQKIVQESIHGDEQLKREYEQACVDANRSVEGSSQQEMQLKLEFEQPRQTCTGLEQQLQDANATRDDVQNIVQQSIYNDEQHEHECEHTKDSSKLQQEGNCDSSTKAKVEHNSPSSQAEIGNTPLLEVELQSSCHFIHQESAWQRFTSLSDAPKYQPSLADAAEMVVAPSSPPPSSYPPSPPVPSMSSSPSLISPLSTSPLPLCPMPASQPRQAFGSESVDSQAATEVQVSSFYRGVAQHTQPPPLSAVRQPLVEQTQGIPPVNVETDTCSSQNRQPAVQSPVVQLPQGFQTPLSAAQFSAVKSEATQQVGPQLSPQQSQVVQMPVPSSRALPVHVEVETLTGTASAATVSQHDIAAGPCLSPRLTADASSRAQWPTSAAKVAPCHLSQQVPQARRLPNVGSTRMFSRSLSPVVKASMLSGPVASGTHVPQRESSRARLLISDDLKKFPPHCSPPFAWRCSWSSQAMSTCAPSGRVASTQSWALSANQAVQAA